jgi:predicted metal-dependent RNase
MIDFKSIFSDYISYYGYGIGYNVIVENPYNYNKEYLTEAVKLAFRPIKLVPNPDVLCNKEDLKNYFLNNYNYSIENKFNPYLGTVKVEKALSLDDKLKILKDTGYYVKEVKPLYSKIQKNIESFYYENLEQIWQYRKNFAEGLKSDRVKATRLLFTPLGGGREIGRSCYLFRTEHSKILVDFGIGFKLGEEIPDIYVDEVKDILSIDAVIITHPHLDHVGALTKLIELKYKNPIFMTAGCQSLTYINFLDSFKLFNNQTGNSLDLNITKKNVKKLFIQTIILQRDRKYRITSDVLISLRNSCHILGGVMIQFYVNNKKILFTSDFNLPTPGVQLLKAPSIYNPVKYDVIISEATNIEKYKTGTENELNDILINIIRDAKAKNGCMLMPVLLIGRGQQILYRLKLIFEMKPEIKYPIYIEPSIQQITNLYKDHPYELSGVGKEFIESSLIEKDVTILNKNNKNNPLEYPGIILAPSGMLEGGSSVLWLIKLMEDATSYCVLSCHQPSDALGKHLLTTAENEIIKFSYNGAIYEKILRIKPVTISPYLGGHITRHSLMKLLNTKSDRVVIIHCTPSTNTVKTLEMNGWRIPQNLETIKLI